MSDDNQYAYLQKFDYARGSTKIKVAANQYFVKEYCLDLGVIRRQDATNLHLYECVDVPQQQFWITDAGDDHIALEGEYPSSADVHVLTPLLQVTINASTSRPIAALRRTLRTAV